MRHADKNGRHTASGDGRSGANVRAQIAQVAARLIAEGLTDFLAAKQKAARQLGVTDAGVLPDNHDIERALREHQAIFESESQPRELAALRDAALRLMHRLEKFSPRLVGAILAGTANRYSEIELDLLGTGPKDFEMYLLNIGVPFEITGLAALRPEQDAVVYLCEFGDHPVAITLFPNHAARQKIRTRGSLKHDSADIREAKARFEG